MKSWSESEHLEHHHSVRLMAEFTYLSKPDLSSPCLFCESLSHQFLSYSYSALTQSLIFHLLSCDLVSVFVIHILITYLIFFLFLVLWYFQYLIGRFQWEYSNILKIDLWVKKTQQNFCELFDWALYVSHLYLLNALDHLSLELSQSQ